MKILFNNTGKVSSLMLLAIASITVTTLIVGAVVYSWQESSIEKLSQQNKALKEQISNLKDRINSLEKQTKEINDYQENNKDNFNSGKTARELIENRASKAINALKNKEMDTLSNLIHPDKGIRFSPYAYVNIENDLVFSAEQIKTLMNDKTKYNWGSYDGSGKPIQLTFKEYYDRFVYDKDFANAEKIGYNKMFGTGNTYNNAFEVYPGAVIVEYHFPGFNEQYKGMDWRSLRLVFEKKGESWYITGIIHDEWTI